MFGLYFDVSIFNEFAPTVNFPPPVVDTVATTPSNFNWFAGVPYLLLAVGCVDIDTLDIVSFTTMSKLAVFPSYVTVIVWFPACNPSPPAIVHLLATGTSFMLATFLFTVTLLFVISTAVKLFPLFVLGVICPPVKFIVSPSLYVNVVGCFDMLVTGSVMLKFIVAVL